MKVPQSARDAAADHYERVEPMGFGFISCAIRDGRRDDDPRVQAFVADGPMDDWSPIDREFRDGYREANDPDAPEPNTNRHPAYRHSFAVRRAEMAGSPIPAAVSRAAAAAIEAECSVRSW